MDGKVVNVAKGYSTEQGHTENTYFVEYEDGTTGFILHEIGDNKMTKTTEFYQNVEVTVKFTNEEGKQATATLVNPTLFKDEDGIRINSTEMNTVEEKHNNIET